MQMTLKTAEDFFSELYLGRHHIPAGGIKPYGQGWCVNHYGDLSTYDFNTLTRLIFLAHDMCVRVEITQGGPRAVKIAIWQREGRNGSIFERHPTIDEALQEWRKTHKFKE